MLMVIQQICVSITNNHVIAGMLACIDRGDAGIKLNSSYSAASPKLPITAKPSI